MSKEKMNPYSVEFKERAVKLALESDQPIAHTARDLGVNESTTHTWISKYQDGGNGNDIVHGNDSRVMGARVSWKWTQA